MIVVGGVYREQCAWPPRDLLMGSGLRAAAALSGSRKIHLHSAVDEGTKQEAIYTAGGYGLSLTSVTRSEPVGFEYYTPVSDPAIDGRMATVDGELLAVGDAALVFGMIECEPTVDADRLVLDPQQPRDLAELKLDALSFNELAVCANAAETIQVGRRKSLRAAARSLLRSSGARVVVTKCGAIGALVTTARAQHEVGPFPSERVWPLGTGDVFAAGFAYGWASRRLPPLRAARLASAAASIWASQQTLPIPVRRLASRTGRPTRFARPRIYIAGPYFSLAERWLVDLVKATLEGLGARTFSPFHEVGPGGDEVAMQDIKGIQQCDGMLVLLDGEDGGTVFEAGWATRHDLPIVAYAQTEMKECRKMLRGTGAELHEDLSTAIYRAIWRAASRSQRT